MAWLSDYVAALSSAAGLPLSHLALSASAGRAWLYSRTRP